MINERRLLCRHCGHFCSLSRKEAVRKEIKSATWQKAYEKYKVKNPELPLY